jgi:hypothetical protein
MAGLVGRKPLGQVLPPCPTSKDQENPTEDLSVISPWPPPAVWSAGQWRDQRFDESGVDDMARVYEVNGEAGSKVRLEPIAHRLTLPVSPSLLTEGISP